MLDSFQICPYTGLRSFTEEESLYFKGREEHIEHATEQLQRNKFLMLTGASGDGKSSLVYAGIVPNARAGFLKSKYTQWCVADFRPERTPFRNLARSLARQLDIPHTATAESELQHGFSALVDLYRNSRRYIDTESLTWQQANDSEKAALKREAANLIILCDQFEEFFTNPENYHRGVPSRDSNLVLNLLLETARIALEEDLPIYVIFTMRSDYIGQCAAFRALPEYIGFSQFFVPRLNRQQLQQVIEEPASLSGNRISRRLTERLIHDISEGVDQLPILQHALSQIWQAARKGADEMDLIHYAMVGGLSVEELPEEQARIFQEWFRQQPESIRAFYREPNLQNVLDTHANKLFESASGTYQSRTGKTISEESAKDIIKKTFICLTKIDESRAVRNRMTLKEIRHIINRPEVDTETLRQVLHIFREPGNTFIRPFILEEAEEQPLLDEDILDITHESLIRNWELLDAWAKEEFNNYTISLDFEQQLNRWVESGKSGDFLLPIGPLTYFEGWYNTVNPNAWWIARYLPEDETEEKKITEASAVLQNARDFLKRSARKHFFTRTMIRYGPRRIAAVFGLLAFLVLSSFGLKSLYDRQNNVVLRDIGKESVALAGRKKVALEDKSILLAENLKLGLTTIQKIAKGIEDPVERINAMTGLATSLVYQGRHEPLNLITQSLRASDSLLDLVPIKLSTERYPEYLREVNDLMTTLDFASYLNPTEAMKDLNHKNAERAAQWLMLIAQEKPIEFKDIKNLDMAIERAISHKALEQDQISALIRALSPLEQSAIDPWIQSHFRRDILSERGNFNYAFSFNGLYQELAYLYAAAGNTDRTLQCLDTLMRYNNNYHDNDYSHMPDHAAHIAAAFHTYHQEKQLDDFVKGYCSRKKIDESLFYRILVAYARLNTNASVGLNYYSFMNRFVNGILSFSEASVQQYYFKKYRKSLRAVEDKDLSRLYLALSYKDQGVNLGMLQEQQAKEVDVSRVNSLFDSAFMFYRQVSNGTRERKVPMYFGFATQPLKNLFIYPDWNSPELPGEARGGGFWTGYYSSDWFLRYVLANKLLDELYQSEDDIKQVESWFGAYRLVVIFPMYLREPIKTPVLSSLHKEMNRIHGPSGYLNDLYVLLAGRLADDGKKDSALLLYSQVDPSKIQNIGFPGMRYSAKAITDLSSYGEFDKAYRFVQAYKKPANRSSLYGYSAIQLIRQRNPLMADRLIDSARVEMLRVENAGVDQQSRLQLPYAMSMRSGPQDVEEATQIIKNVAFKFIVQQKIVRSVAFNSHLYESRAMIPLNVSGTDRTVFLWNLLTGYTESLPKQDAAWDTYVNNHRFFYNRLLFYDDEN